MCRRDLPEKLRARADRLERGAARMRRRFPADTRELRWLQARLLAGPQATNRAIQAMVSAVGIFELSVMLMIDLPEPAEVILVLVYLWLVVRLCIPAGIAADEAHAGTLRAAGGKSAD